MRQPIKHVGAYGPSPYHYMNFGVGVGTGTGVTTAADITLTGIAMDDKIFMAFFMGSSHPTNLSHLTLSEISIPSANSIRLSTTDTTDGRLLVGYTHVTDAPLD